MVNGAKRLEVDGDVVRIGREAEAGLEQYELPLPAAVGVKEGINLPRYPTMKGRLASKKASVATVDARPPSPAGCGWCAWPGPPSRSRRRRSSATDPTPRPAVVDLLEQLGVLRRGRSSSSSSTTVARWPTPAATPWPPDGRWRRTGEELAALTIGAAADGLAEELTALGADAVHQAHHDLLTDYGPEAWGEVVAQVTVAFAAERRRSDPGTERGNEVLAQAAARLDAPLVANCTAIGPSGDGFDVTRHPLGRLPARAGDVDRDAGAADTIALHAFDARPRPQPGAGAVKVFEPTLDPALARSVVRDRVDRVAGMTLATAPVVVGGGRGVGSAAGVRPARGAGRARRRRRRLLAGRHQQRLAQPHRPGRPDRHPHRADRSTWPAASRAPSSTGWGRWRRSTSSAINTDPDANMVTKADYAVIGDLHEVVPAISAEIRRRRGG